MQIPLQITYIHMYAPDGLDDIIREHVAQLEQRFGRIMSCRVVWKHRTSITAKALTITVG